MQIGVVGVTSWSEGAMEFRRGLLGRWAVPLVLQPACRRLDAVTSWTAGSRRSVRPQCLLSINHLFNEGWKKTSALATAEACDSNAALLASGDLRVLQPIFQTYGKRRAFSGPISTVKIFEHNSSVKEILETGEKGGVLVIDGGGSIRRALVGGILGQVAQNMGWAGIVVNGCIRDVDDINRYDIGVRALASFPWRSNKSGVADHHVPVYIAGSWIRDGEWLYADSDGIIVSKSELSI